MARHKHLETGLELRRLGVHINKAVRGQYDSAFPVTRRPRHDGHDRLRGFGKELGRRACPRGHRLAADLILFGQPLLDRHRLTAIPAGMAQEHPRHAPPPIGTGIRSRAIRHHHGLSRLPIASPAETGGICGNCLTGPTHRNAERRPLQLCSP